MKRNESALTFNQKDPHSWVTFNYESFEFTNDQENEIANIINSEIHGNWEITGNQCLYNGDASTGEFADTILNALGSQDIDITQYHIHSLFNRETQQNEIIMTILGYDS